MLSSSSWTGQTQSTISRDTSDKRMSNYKPVEVFGVVEKVEEESPQSVFTPVHQAGKKLFIGIHDKVFIPIASKVDEVIQLLYHIEFNQCVSLFFTRSLKRASSQLSIEHFIQESGSVTLT